MRFRVFRIGQETKRFAYFSWKQSEDGLELFDGRVKGKLWRRPNVYVPHPSREAWDIAPFMGLYALVMTRRSLECLSDYFDSGGVELLPFSVEGTDYTVINVTELCDCLDRRCSTILPDHTIERFVFDPHRFTRSLFKLPELRTWAPFVAEDDIRPDWSFKRAVERCNLKGITFEAVWPAPVKSDVPKRRILENVPPRPEDLKVIAVGSEGVLLEWSYSHPDVSCFGIEFFRGGEFRAINEAVVPGSEHAALDDRIIYRGRDEHPLSGVTHYRIRAIRRSDGALSEPSEAVMVKNENPARGAL